MRRSSICLQQGYAARALAPASVWPAGNVNSIVPQHLPIRQLLKDASRELEGPVYKAARLGVKILKLW